MTQQKITIEPVTRIEGHAKITIRMNDDGSVDHAYLHINEFRGFEKFCEGRLYFEMPQITPRICGICPVSHHLAAAKAGDDLMGCPPPRPANLLRDLMHMGQIIQSHGMHFFELAGPDLLLGFDYDPAYRNVVGLIGADPALTLKAVQPAQVRAGDHQDAGRPPVASGVCRAGRRQQIVEGRRARLHPEGCGCRASKRRRSA